jgi:hypothetical protein
MWRHLSTNKIHYILVLSSLLALLIGKKRLCICAGFGFGLGDKILAHSLTNMGTTNVDRMKIFRWMSYFLFGAECINVWWKAEPLCDELHVIYGNGLTNIEKTLFLCHIHWNGSKEMSHQLLVAMWLRTITFAKIKYFQFQSFLKQ